MAFTAGYKVNEGTQYEFTVSNETIQEMVQASDTGIGEADLGPYCYSALIDSRVYQLRAAQGNFGWPGETGAAFASIAKESCPGIVEGWSEQMTSEHPAFNKQLLDNSDVVYQRNFMVWEGTIYPGTENEKTGTFLVMDMVDIKRWYCNFDNAGFGTANVTSAIGEEAPEEYVWPGYTGPIYTYISNVVGQGPDILCDNNDPHLNPNTNLKVKNILVVNDEYWVGSLNPSTHSNDYMGGSGCAYAGKSLYAFYWNGSSNGGYLTNQSDCYQKGSLSFMGLPDYSNAPELPGAPRNDIGSLNYNCYAVTDSDSIVVNLTGNWGQQNYASGISFVNNSSTTQLTSVLKWQSWCGLKFQYQDTMYKPIIQDGVIVGYSDDMDAESEYDDMTNVTGNNIPITPPGPTPPGPSGDDPWHGVDFGGTGAGGGGAFCSVYYMTGAELTSLKNWSNTSAPEGFDMLPSIIGLQQLPVSVDGVPTTVKFLKSAAITSQGESRLVDTGVSAGTGTGQPVSFSLGSIDINRRMSQRGEPYLDYDSTIELFLPFAGTFVLDTQAVMGRTINAEIVIDPVNGTAFAYAWVSQSGQKMPIAYGGGSIAVDLPIASNQWGISRAAFKQASHQMTMNAIKDIGDFIIGLGISKTGQAGAIANRSGYAALDIKEGLQAKQIGGQMMTSSTINAATDTASAIVNAHQLNNTNYTAIRGSFGGSYAEWSQPFTAYVRITRPKFKKPSNFNHTQAVPCVETRKLSACTGLTICINPDCGAIPCTEAEKLMITQALVGGVYAGR